MQGFKAEMRSEENFLENFTDSNWLRYVRDNNCMHMLDTKLKVSPVSFIVLAPPVTKKMLERYYKCGSIGLVVMGCLSSVIHRA